MFCWLDVYSSNFRTSEVSLTEHFLVFSPEVLSGIVIAYYIDWGTEVWSKVFCELFPLLVIFASPEATLKTPICSIWKNFKFDGI